MYRVPYGNEILEFSLPPGMRATVAVSKPASPLEDERAAVAEALARPLGRSLLRAAPTVRPGTAGQRAFHREASKYEGQYGKSADR